MGWSRKKMDEEGNFWKKKSPRQNYYPKGIGVIITPLRLVTAIV